MENFFEIIVSAIILSFVNLYIWNKLLGEKINLFSIKGLMVILINSISISFNYIFNNAYLRIMSITIIFSFIIKVFYKKSYIKSLSIAVFGQIIFMIADIIFSIFVFFLNDGDLNNIKETYFSKIFSNISVSLISLILINIYKIKEILKTIIELIENVKKRQILFLLMALMLSINLLLCLIYYQIDTSLIVIIISVLLLIYTYITLNNITQQEKLVNIRIEYEQLMDKSVKYEQVLDGNKRELHELKNDFGILQVLIKKSKKEALKQLDFMIKEYGKVEKILNDNDKYYFKTLKIPSGGIRGLLSTKLKLMDDLEINYNLRIGDGINSKLLENTNTYLVRQVGKLLGIYLDNAIYAVRDLKKKDINIEIFVNDNYFNILISNTLNGIFELDKINNMGYTTKGNGHGYGLSLAAEILKNTNEINVNTILSSNVITKIIELKI